MSIYFDHVGKAIDCYINTYDRFIIAGDHNTEIKETVLGSFMGTFVLHSLVTENTCFKSANNPTCIDLFPTNCLRPFQNTTALSSGMSDFHKLIVTVLKTTFSKAKPKIVSYRCYKNFVEANFKNDLKSSFQSINTNKTSYVKFEKTFLAVLNKHAPIKNRTVRANEMQYMTKTLRKTMSNISRLEHIYHKIRSETNFHNFKKQRNNCSRLYKHERKKFYKNLDISSITDNRKFWRTLKPFFTDKGTTRNCISLIEDDMIISDDKEVAGTLNSFFDNAVKSLNLKEPVEYINDTDDIETATTFQLELANRFLPLVDALPTDIEEFSDAVNNIILETAEKVTPSVKSPAPTWMQKDTQKAINNKKDVRKKHGDSSTQYKIAKAETKKLVKN